MGHGNRVIPAANASPWAVPRRRRGGRQEDCGTGVDQVFKGVVGVERIRRTL